MIYRIPPKEKNFGHDWGLSSRAKGLGGGDAAVVMGVSGFNSLYAIWAQKTGRVAREDISGKSWIEWGRLLELPIAEKYSSATARLLVDRAEESDKGRFDMRHGDGDLKFMCSNLDFEIACPTEPFKSGDFAWKPEPERTFALLMAPAPSIRAVGPGSLSVKTTNSFAKEKWIDEPPLDAQMQLQHELAVTGFEWGSIAVLIGGSDYRMFDLERDDDFISVLVAAEEKFWYENVMGDKEPEVDGHKKTKEALAKIWPKAEEKVVALSEKATDAWNSAVEQRDIEKEAKGKKQKFQNIVAAEMKDAQDGELADGSGVVRYPLIVLPEKVMAATSFRRFFFRKTKN